MKKAVFFSMTLFLMLSCNKNETLTEGKPTEKDNSNSFQDTVLEYDKLAKPILFEYTSTGCPGCGSWGKPTFNSIINQNKDKIVPLAIHIKYGDPMITSISEAIAANRYGSLYTPQIWLNDSNGVVLTGGYISSQTSINNINAMKENALLSSNAIIGGSVIKKSNHSVYIKTGIKESEAFLNGEYFLSCYLLNDSLVHHQSSSPYNPTIHNYVIRKAVDDIAWGKQIKFLDGKFEFQYEFKNYEANKINYFVSILWKKENNRYVPKGAFRFE